MKQLQNNFTTPEQSKRLLELGVPADSADCYFDGRNIRRLRSEDWMLKQNFFIEYSYFTPCWSVGVLLQICRYASVNGGVEKMIKYLATTVGLSLYRRLCNMPEFIVDYILDHPYDFDFSKIEL